MYLLVLNQLLTMMFITIAGLVFAKIVKVTDEQQKFLSRLLLYFINPCLVINSFNMEFDAQKLKQLGYVILIAFLVHIVLITIGFLTSKDNLERLATVFTNCGFVGIPLINGVFGSEGVFYLMGYLVVFNVILWTWGYYLMSGSINLKKIVTNPNIIAVVIGLVLFCMPFTLPSFIAKPVELIGGLNTATAMILLGVLLSQFKFEKNYAWRITKFTLIRLVLCSIISIFVLWGLYKLTGGMVQDSKTMIFVVLIASMCPSATSIPSLACVFDKNKSYASLIVSVTSVFCIVTLPVFVAFAEQIIK